MTLNMRVSPNEGKTTNNNPTGQPLNFKLLQEISEVARDLKKHRKAHQDRFDPRLGFTFMYEKFTDSLILHLIEEKFNDPEWLIHLAKTFAQYYTDVCDKAQGIPKFWGLVFDTACVNKPIRFPPKSSFLQTFLLSMLVHLMHDLPLAVFEVSRDSTQHPQNGFPNFRKMDFDEINKLVEEYFDELQGELSLIYPFLFLLDFLGRGNDEVAFVEGIKEARNYAWLVSGVILESNQPGIKVLEKREFKSLEATSYPPFYYSELARISSRLSMMSNDKDKYEVIKLYIENRIKDVIDSKNQELRYYFLIDRLLFWALSMYKWFKKWRKKMKNQFNWFGPIILPIRSRTR